MRHGYRIPRQKMVARYGLRASGTRPPPATRRKPAGRAAPPEDGALPGWVQKIQQLIRNPLARRTQNPRKKDANLLLVA